ncbi:YbaB/EbfC family nucleoid-associated protein [Nocardia sp. NPDC051990]|uniref:YbaB/EbfC family nucleoid-associated protein n=1 Tax=Nocardia sp. NPDC051990 TaxID=3155285 RepID=UPI003419D5A3
MNHVMDEIEARAHRQLHRMRELGERMAAIRVRETSTDGAITAEVDGNGALCDLVFTTTVSRMSPRDFEQLLVATAAQAAARAFAERAELVNAFNAEGADLPR